MSRDPQTILNHYIVAALWSSFDDDGRPLDENYNVRDVASETRLEMLADVERFLDLIHDLDTAWWTDEQLGHDLWLTRNGHGAGFWDRGQSAGEELTRLATTLGEVDLYELDGQIHQE